MSYTAFCPGTNTSSVSRRLPSPAVHTRSASAAKFVQTPRLLADINDVVHREKQCCPFLSFATVIPSDGTNVGLDATSSDLRARRSSWPRSFLSPAPPRAHRPPDSGSVPGQSPPYRSSQPRVAARCPSGSRAPTQRLASRATSPIPGLPPVAQVSLLRNETDRAKWDLFGITPTGPGIPH